MSTHPREREDFLAAVEIESVPERRCPFIRRGGAAFSSRSCESTRLVTNAATISS